METIIIEPPEELQNRQQRLEKNKIMHDAADAFNCCVNDLIVDGESLIKYIDTHDLNVMLDDMYKDMERLKEQINKKDIDACINDIQVPIIDLGTVCVCLFERLNKDVRKAEELEKQEMEKQQELLDLANAKFIFEMLKDEVLKCEDDFDEWTISMYIKYILEIAQKHKVDLGVSNENESEEIMAEDICTPDEIDKTVDNYKNNSMQ